MSIDQYISSQPAERQELLRALHRVIVDNDTTVTATIGAMMGKEMILYNAPGSFKYGLASVKNYMSLHAMPIYMNPALYDKYKKQLPHATFQKGCINFTGAEEVPLNIMASLIRDCSVIDLKKIRDEYMKSKKKK